ncbi:phage tail tape measure protein [Lysinibacillus sp. JNUCC 51]|uniref:phage tail tape measure protein n=1 Tax=Lysinibacillus sp. JNUCC-51 TaxID=2792479 RepID=UPI0019368143|nr:phage tail tape measure protein [Lysinibacillus sp. JNUCC-51]
MAEISAVELSLNTSNFDGSIEQSIRRLTAMGAELQALQALGTNYENSMEGLSKKQDILTRSVEASNLKLREQRNKYEELIASESANTEAIEKQAIAVNEALVEYNRLTTQLKDVENQLNVQSSSWNKFQEAGGKVKSVGESISSITAPIKGFGAFALNAAVDFESAFAGVRQTVNTSEEGFKKLEDGIRGMAKELPVSATEIAGVVESAGQLGIAEEHLLSFSRTVIDMGNSTSMTREQAAKEFADFAKIVGMGQGDFDRLGSSIVELSSKMNVSASDIMAMGKGFAEQASKAGLTEVQIMGLAATMSSLGIKAETGGAAMTSVLQKIQKAVGDGGDSLSGFAKAANMSSADFKKAFETDAASALDALVKGLAESAEGGANLTSILSDLGVSGNETDVLLKMAGASDLLSSAVNSSSAAWEENTALSDKAAERYKTTESQMATMKNELTDIGISIGNILIPIVKSFLEKLQPWIEKFSNLSDGTKTLITIIGGIAAVIGPVIVAFGTVISTVGTIIGAISSLGSVFAVLSGPIGWIVAAIAALIAGGIALYKNWDVVSAKAVEIWEGIASFFSELWTSITEAASAAWEGFTQLLTDLWTSIIDGAIEIWGGMVTFFSELWTNITELASIAWEEYTQLLTDLWTSIIDGAIVVWEGMVTFFSELWTNITELASIAWEEFTQLLSDLWTSIIDGAIEIWEGMVTFFSELWTNITELASIAWEEFTQLLSDLWTSIIDGAIEIWEGMVTFFSELWTNITELASIAWEEFTQLLSDLWTSIIDGAIEIWEGMVTFFSELWTNITELASIAWEEFTQLLSDLWTSIIDGAIEIWTSFVESLSNIWTSIVDIAATIWGTISSTIIEIVTTIINGIEVGWNKLKETTEIVFNVVKSFLSDVWNNVKNMIVGTVGSIVDLVVSGWTRFSQMTTNTFNTIKNFLSNVWESIKTTVVNTATRLVTSTIQKFLDIKVAIETKMNEAKRVVTDIWDKILSIFRALDLRKIGKDIIQGLINGIGDMADLVWKKAKSIATSIGDAIKSTLKINSPSRVMIAIGRGVGEGLAIGIEKGSDGVNRAAEKLAEAAIPDFTERLSISKEAIEKAQQIVSNVIKANAAEMQTLQKEAENKRAEISQQASDKITAIKNNAAKKHVALTADQVALIKKIEEQSLKDREAITNQYADKMAKVEYRSAAEKFRALKEYVEAQKSAGEMSAKQEAEFWRYSATAFKEGTKEKTNALKEFKKAYSDMVKEQFEKEKDYVEKRKKYNSISLAEELKIYERYLGQYEAGTDERTYYEEKFYNTKKEISEKIKTINNDYLKQTQDVNKKLLDEEQKLNDDYNKALESRIKSIKGYFGLFDEVKVADPVDSSSLTQNLSEQVNALSQWRIELSKLEIRGLSSEIIDELEAMGPSVLAQLEALNRMTDAEMFQYQDLYEKKLLIARESAIKELEPLEAETKAKIEGLRKTANSELNTLNSEWQKKIKDVVLGTEETLGSMNEIGKNAIQGLIDGMNGMQSALQQTANNLVQNVSDTLRDVLNLSPTSSLLQKIGDGLVDGFDSIMNKATNVSKLLANSVTHDSSSLLPIQKSKNNKTSQNSGPSTIVVQSILDGQVLGESVVDVVSGKQYSNASIHALTRGLSGI